ncbi:MAG TPA: hypothetical protein PKE03_10135 [Bacteroidales bacterium]|mgnify:CR=1 FL=1|nr:hypothetical protein [Bacteroidales bacterium]
MTKTIPDRQLTQNFSLYEFIEGSLPPEGVALNWRHIHLMDMAKIEEVAKHAQTIRDLINREFKSDLGHTEIGLRIMSGWRCPEWELRMGRSGQSQHTIAAYDATPILCSKNQAASIIGWLYHRFSRSYVGGFAIKKPTFQDGKMILPGFVHFDFRGSIARWEY